VISTIFTEQAIDNIGLFADNRNAIPNQLTLANGVTQLQNGLTAGIAPNIALRAIAITGFNLSSSNNIQQSWATVPVVDFDKIARIQLLYQFAMAYQNGHQDL
jgi:hypothetical protein